MQIIRISILIILYLSTSLNSSVLGSETLNGIWITEDQSSKIEFYRCGSATCGKIIWLNDPVDITTGKNWVDKFNSEPILRNRPLLGIDIIYDLKLDNIKHWVGKLYNPLDGKTYLGKLNKKGFSQIELKGCIFAGIICKTETWKRLIN